MAPPELTFTGIIQVINSCLPLISLERASGKLGAVHPPNRQQAK